jgi:hypothetical protein
MNVISKVKERLQKYPEIRFQEDENSISVLPTLDNGFTVTLIIGYDDIKVFYNGWHEDFEDEEVALNCFALGLSGRCRLIEFRRENEPYKWTLEYLEKGNWIEDSTISLFNFSFWQNETTHYLQNDLIK